MDRLTEKRDGQNVIPLRQDGKTIWALTSAGIGYKSTQFLYGNHADKLAEYEDAEEQGLLLRLPCHIGDILYEPTNRNTISEYRVTGFKREVFALWIEWKLEKGFIYQSIYGVEIGEIGKTVFLTKEEAEQALANMKAGAE